MMGYMEILKKKKKNRKKEWKKEYNRKKSKGKGKKGLIKGWKCKKRIREKDNRTETKEEITYTVTGTNE